MEDWNWTQRSWCVFSTSKVKGTLSLLNSKLKQTVWVDTLQGTNISHQKSLLKMIFLFPWWDMLIPWRVAFCSTGPQSTTCLVAIISSDWALSRQTSSEVFLGCFGVGANVPSSEKKVIPVLPEADYDRVVPLADYCWQILWIKIACKNCKLWTVAVLELSKETRTVCHWCTTLGVRATSRNLQGSGSWESWVWFKVCFYFLRS